MKQRRDSSSLITAIFFISLLAGAIFIYKSSMFERDVPEVKMNNMGYWNLKDPLHVNISDASGIIEYSVTLTIDDKDYPIANEKLMSVQKSVALDIKPPRDLFRLRTDKAKVTITARDTSKWNFFHGNVVNQVVNFVIDSKKPVVMDLANSYAIEKGGSALVIFKAMDEHLKSVKIITNFGKDFYAQPFVKPGYYIALIAWPINQPNFRATVEAEDMAGNKAQDYVKLYLKNREYQVSNLELKDEFLDGKIEELSHDFEETQGVTDRIEKFRLINETVRAHNEELIHKITSKIDQKKMITDFSIKPLHPLENGAPVASYADHRIYSYNGKVVSQAYHMGLDLASVHEASIISQNPGRVVFTKMNGLYGNNPIIDHGLGLYTLYGHCSSISVTDGDEVKPGQVIAKTGTTGYAMGDHLHFGVLVQGIEVRPEEWMDTHWMKLNIEDVIRDGKAIVERQ
jgi:murein DD-endopeptidase MepM/ murein hydrolase activator NlpD